MKTRALLILALLISCFCVIQFAAALVAPDEEVRSTIDQVKQTVQGHSGKNEIVLDQKLKDILYPLFDWDAMSRSSLGANWQKATPEEQKQFKELFSELLSRTYLKRIKSNVTTSKIEVTTAKVDGDKALVKTVVSGDGDPVNIDYRLQSNDGKWRAYDVIIENVGMISNYRTEFGEIVRKDGMPALIEKLRNKESEKTEESAVSTPLRHSREDVSALQGVCQIYEV